MLNPAQAQTIDYAVNDARRAADQRAIDVISRAKSIISDLERTIRAVEHGGIINSLGELQGSAASFDISCALYSRERDAVASAEHLRDRLAAQQDEQPTDMVVDSDGLLGVVLAVGENADHVCVLTDHGNGIDEFSYAPGDVKPATALHVLMADPTYVIRLRHAYTTFLNLKAS